MPTDPSQAPAHWQVVLESQNPRDPTPDKLIGLATALEKSLPGVRVELGSRPQVRRYGVTWYEVLYAWALQPLPEAILAAMIVEIGKWCVARRKGNGRPQSAAVLGPDGRVLRWVRIDEEGVYREGERPAKGDEFPMGGQQPTQRIGRLRAKLAALRRGWVLRVGSIRRRLRRG